MTFSFYLINLALLSSGLLGFRMRSSERQFSLSLLRALFGLPILSGVYIYFAYDMQSELVPLVLFSEMVFALIWFFWAHRLYQATIKTAPESRWFSVLEVFMGGVILWAVWYALSSPEFLLAVDGAFIIPSLGVGFFSAIFILVANLYMAWRLEGFWRGLSSVQRWEHKYLVIGCYLVCGLNVWSTSYRLTYLGLVADHFLLLAPMLLLAWCLIIYAVARHRLLNRKIFVSRKVVYSFVAPLVFGLYLLVLGFVGLVMRAFGWPLPFVLQWLFIVLGLVAVAVFVFSRGVRRMVHYFISTHFYINKYEYRDEWLAFSRLLKEVLTEPQVVNALCQVLTESILTKSIVIWMGDEQQGYEVVFSMRNADIGDKRYHLSPPDPLILYVREYDHFYLVHKEDSKSWLQTVQFKRDFFSDLNVVLVAPISIGDKLVGLIGLGPEYTGSRYGKDDFDLLSALGSQAAAAVLAGRMAEELSSAKQREAWGTLAAFVLHDLKNVASMLSLVRANSPAHLSNPKFQQDMLGTIDDAIKRISKVENLLVGLREEIVPICQELNLYNFLQATSEKLVQQLSGLEIRVHGHKAIIAEADPGSLTRVLENLMINSMEAGGPETVVDVTVRMSDDHQAPIDVEDNGPGLPKELLPDALFLPFKSTKPDGTGIGLWQVKRLVGSLGGTISADNVAGKGARFILTLPARVELSENIEKNSE